jgi:hypothetical protein
VPSAAFGQLVVWRRGQFGNRVGLRIELQQVVGVLLIATAKNVNLVVVGLRAVAPFLDEAELGFRDLVQFPLEHRLFINCVMIENCVMLDTVNPN